MEDDGCERSFVWGNGLIAARDDENEMFFFHDHLGSPVRLMGSVGDTGHGVPMAYDEFGGRLHGTNTFGQPFGFTGYQDEDVTGLYYAQARYYEPRGGRFIAEDPFWAIQRIYEHNLQGLNLYLYCLNDPVSRIDPSGLDNWFLYDPKDFSDHVESELMRLRDSYGTTAHAIPVTTVAEFIDAWNSIGAGGVTIDAVSLLFHGSSQTINIDSDDNQYLTLLSTGLTPEGNPALFIGDLQDKAISVLYLMTCNSGHLDRKVNLPTAFLDNFNGISNVIGWDGGTAYTRYMYFDDNNVPQTYYNVRLAINQTGRFRSYAPPIGPFGLFRRSPVGMVNYSRDGIEVLGTPKISPDTIIDGRMIYRSPR
jgi:RHS repeat-associated protein